MDTEIDTTRVDTPLAPGSRLSPIRSVKTECPEAGFSLRTTERAAHNLSLVWTRDYGMNMWSLPKAG